MNWLGRASSFRKKPRKDEFLALLAHELRNPLAPIRSALDVLQLTEMSDLAAQEAREVAERQLRHLTRLVDDLLDVSRIMRGRVELRKERISLEAAVARAVETVRPIMKANRQELDVTLPKEAVWLDADGVRLAQVLGNLLSNAAKYTEPEGKISLAAHVENERVRVCVRDNGIGIEPDVVPHIFEMFMQVAPGATRSQGGLGIGLTLVKSLVELHEGTVEARSKGLGQGSEFIVSLPVAARAKVAELPERARPGLSSRRKVLVVDDRAACITSLIRVQGFCSRWGYDRSADDADRRRLE
jgi:signal transduction histidine kinase